MYTRASRGSTVILAQFLPRSSLLGVDLNPGNLRIARARAELYRMPQVEFLQSPGGDSLPPDLGTFDAIVLSAVYEHLLAGERETLMPMLWDLLLPGGILFLDETPARWFPIETHTTGLPLLNYLPDGLAAVCARRCSRRVSRTASWEALCRDGVRGASEGEILRTLSGSVVPPRRIAPHRLGIGNPVDLWYQGYAEAEPGPRGGLKRGARHVLRAASAILRTPMVPYLSLAIRKGPSA
jgi:SAM-dependent methyltransferase